MATAFPGGARRRRDVPDDVSDDVSDDVISSRQRRAIDGFTSDGMEVSIQIGSTKTQANPVTQSTVILYK